MKTFRMFCDRCDSAEFYTEPDDIPPADLSCMDCMGPLDNWGEYTKDYSDRSQYGRWIPVAKEKQNE